MGSVYNRVRAKVYFLMPEEDGRSRNVDRHSPRSPYDLLADVGLGYAEDGFPIRCMVRALRRPVISPASNLPARKLTFRAPSVDVERRPPASVPFACLAILPTARAP